MGEEERKDFLGWYERQRYDTFENKRVLETYIQDDVTVLRQACRVFRGEFMQKDTSTSLSSLLRSRRHAIRCYASGL